MSLLRATIRFIGFTLATLIIYLVYIFGYGLLKLFLEDSTRWSNRVIRLWARATAAIIGLKIYIKGDPPKPPFFLVSNHLSYIDILPYYITTDCIFIAKSEVKEWPILGWMARTTKIIFINRNFKSDIVRVNRVISSYISDQVGIILFPEGTSTGGGEVRPFKSSLLQYASDENFPVSYASIMYRTNDEEKPAHRWVCWWGDMTFLDHFFNLLKLKSFDVHVTYGDQKVRGKDRKRLAESLHQMVQKQFIPTTKR